MRKDKVLVGLTQFQTYALQLLCIEAFGVQC